MTRKRLAALAVVAAVAAGLTGCSDDNGGMGMGGDSGGHHDDGDAADFNPDDVMFAAMMVPHHQQAIEMSDLVLAAPGIDPAVRDLATRIKAAQQPEIELMEGWLDDWGHPSGGGMEGMGGHGMGSGMLSDQELAALTEARGAEAQRLFLEGMIAHHEGAIAMAEDELEDGEYQPALELAQRIIDTQQAEIDEMRELLR